jgi:hypothetical protein
MPESSRGEDGIFQPEERRITSEICLNIAEGLTDANAINPGELKGLTGACLPLEVNRVGCLEEYGSRHIYGYHDQ